MRFLGRLSITIAFLGLIVFLTSTTKAKEYPFERHIGIIPYDHSKETISYQELEAGNFRPDPALRGVVSTQKEQILYPYTPFHKGVPIFFPGRKGYRLRSLQRAYADYSKLHLSGVHHLGVDSLTISKNDLGNPEVAKATPEVHEYSRDTIAALKTFGETAAIVAFGHKLSAARGKFGGLKSLTPGSKTATDPHVAQDNIKVEEARLLLEEDGHLKFNAKDNHASLDIRLLPDGTLEKKWFTSLTPVFHI